jgi:hypothetical protein
MRSLGQAMTGAQITLIILKLLNVVNWSWPLVLSPTIVITGITGVAVLFFLTFWGRI